MIILILLAVTVFVDIIYAEKVVIILKSSILICVKLSNFLHINYNKNLNIKH